MLLQRNGLKTHSMDTRLEWRLLKSGDKVKDVIPSMEDNKDEKKNVSDQYVNGNNDTEEVETTEEEVHNKELEVAVERMTADMMNHNDAQAIVQVPQAKQILNIHPTSSMKELHDLVSHKINDTVVQVCSDEVEEYLKNTDTIEALLKALEHIVVVAGLM
ncbi:hypothetical protein K7X08_034111 [Anisodus acutangulus]|uniref:Uncharacterized protein n=1 Tax=Anisodus acutangulus TaxID=402998 RepID=A0A9Q1RB43_9SOLA|nr:hypothetical protein K7X08_034111 [Anisodus acutangulus]